MKKYAFSLAALFFGSIILAQVAPITYLPADIRYNPQIPTPKKFLGHEVGEWHVSHDKLYYYMLELAKTSDRAIWEEYGRSHENRPLGELIISSPQNLQNLENIRQKHLLLCDPEKSGNLDIKNMPIIIKLGYGVHGNESSAQNASLLTAYYLTAGEGGKLDELLQNAIILIDPCLNPDGMHRHSTWVNATRSLNDNPDPNSWEFREPWPGGRTNHYWFDLNRDWLLLQHPESRGRVGSFHKWRPVIVADNHEMGAHSTFFFQPGIPSRNNPLVPGENYDLTAEIAKYHEKYFNQTPALYYAEESFDDFYVGKGSSYPDIKGSIGILFEQAGLRGHLRETPSGIKSFPFAIKNQFTVSLSTLEAGLEMREKLLDSQRRFYRDAITEAGKFPVKAYIFSEPSDNARTSEFISILLQHQIKVFKLDKTITRNNIEYEAGTSYVVPLKQGEFRLIRSLFEPILEFNDSSFYDVSTWILPMSFNIPYAPLYSEKEMTGITGTELSEAPAKSGKLIASGNTYAYLFDWSEYYTPKALYRLHDEDLTVRVSTDEFVTDVGGSGKRFTYGTIMVTSFDQVMPADEIQKLMESIARECGITIYGVTTGKTLEGIDLGSNAFRILEKPKALMLVGNGLGHFQTGEIWHLLDKRFNIPVTNVTADRMGSIDLNRYNVIIIAGNPQISEAGLENIKTWNNKGGTIIAYGSGNNWLVNNKLAEIEFVPQISSDKTEGQYSDRSADNAVKLIRGAIFETRMDLTHPLCFGYKRDNLPVFKTSNSVAKRNSDIYNNPVVYTDKPLLSGYCIPKNEDRVKGNPFVSVHRNKIISIYDNTNFRAIWYGTEKVFINALFFGQLL